MSACQRALTGGRVHQGPEALEVLHLEHAEQVVAALVDRVVAAAGRPQRVEHLRPDGGVAAAVLGLSAGQERIAKATRSMAALRGDDGPGGGQPPGPERCAARG